MTVTPSRASGGNHSIADPQTWAEMVDANYDRILRVAMLQTRRHELAEEVAQETFIRAFEKHHLFDGEGSLVAWLYRIAVNLSRDALRREKVRSHVVLTPAKAGAAPVPNPPDAAHNNHCARRVREALAEVAEPMRAAFEHTVVMGYSYRETAELLGVSEGTVASRVARTRNVLARRCSELEQ